MAITAARALALRMTSLLLRPGAPEQGDVAGIVEWFGAMQAQDAASAMWTLGSRLPGATADDVQAALERLEAIRTWPMRGTLHLVPPRDARWMLDLMGVRMLTGVAARWAYLGLDGVQVERAAEVLGEALAGGGRMTRAECLAALQAAGLDTAGQRGYHLLWYAAQTGVTCMAAHVGGEQSFVLLDEAVPDPHRPDRDEALATTAVRFFRSHGPASAKDLAGWTALTLTDSRRGIAAAGDRIAAVDVEGVPMHVAPEVLDAAPESLADDEIRVVAGFDEYLLGYKDRSLMLDAAHKQAVVPGGNGIFQWTIVRAGRVIGTWRRTKRGGSTVVDVLPLVPLRPADEQRIAGALEPFGRFLGRPLDVRHP